MTNEKLMEILKIRTEATNKFAAEHPIPQLSEEEICKAAEIYLKDFNWLLDHHFSSASQSFKLYYKQFPELFFVQEVETASFDDIISDIIEKEFKNGIYSILCFIYDEQNTYLDNYCDAFNEYCDKFYEQINKVADKVGELSKNTVLEKLQNIPEPKPAKIIDRLTHDGDFAIDEIGERFEFSSLSDEEKMESMRIGLSPANLALLAQAAEIRKNCR